MGCAPKKLLEIEFRCRHRGAKITLCYFIDFDVLNSNFIVPTHVVPRSFFNLSLNIAFGAAVLGGVFIKFYMTFPLASLKIVNMEKESVGSSTAFPSCFIHFQGKTEDLCKLTRHTLFIIKEYCQEWINLEGEPKTIAENIIDVVRSWPE